MKYRNFKTPRRLITAVLLLCLLVSVSVRAESESAASESGAAVTAPVSEDDNTYPAYHEKNSNIVYAQEDIIISANAAVQATGAEAQFSYTSPSGMKKNNVLVLNSEAYAAYEVDIPADALYNIEITYLPLEGNGNNIEFSLRIDGELPFAETENLILPRMYKNSQEERFDEYGNQYSPEQLELGDFVSRRLFDYTGTVNGSYYFKLNAGRHIITLNIGSEPFVLAELKLSAPDTMLSYSEVSRSYSQNSYGSAEPIVIEGEDAFAKDSKSIVPKSDTASAIVHPSDSRVQKINYIGAGNWKSPGERVDWKADVEKSGLYELRLIYKQDQTINGYSYRTLTVDSRVPFREAADIGFYYGTNWQTYTFSDDEKNPYYIWLDEGEHILSLTATLGETEEFYQRLRQITTALGDLYIEIAMITSDSPDPNRDYDLFRQIPDLNNRLQSYSDSLSSLADDMTELSGHSTSCIAAVNNMVRILDQMTENPYTAQNYVTDYYNNYTTVSSWLYDMKSMPLSIDRIILVPAGEDYDYGLPNIFEKIIFSAERFIVSFSSDYNNSPKSGGDALKIWVNWGRDQAMVLNSLIQESFIPETGIQVNLELTDATLVKGILSDNAPDMALHMARTEPVNLAMRGALYDLTNFDDYEEVIKRFGESASVPYKYGNGVYALPDTQSFYLMFYRKDIFESLDLEVPEAWDDFLEVTAVLQRNNMQAWIPYTQITTSATVNTGVGGLNLFATILQQFGGSLYNDELTACELESSTAMQAFTFWTDMYTKYKLPTTASFYNRFRIGTMPLGIEVYTQYTMLAQAAPEIEGRWGIALVPGVRTEDGTVNRTVAGSGTGCGILSTSDNKEAAWEFLKWWTKAETQLKYNNNVESILGAVSRTTTATIEAFNGMAWKPDDLEVLLEQRSLIEEIPEVPGSYYVSRSVDQAFWNVVNGDSAPKDVLMKWSEIANNEIERKIKQYSNR